MNNKLPEEKPLGPPRPKKPKKFAIEKRCSDEIIKDKDSDKVTWFCGWCKEEDCKKWNVCYRYVTTKARENAFENIMKKKKNESNCLYCNYDYRKVDL